MDSNNLIWQPVDAEGAAPAASTDAAPASTTTAPAPSAATPDPTPRGMSLRRVVGSLVLAAGLLGVGGASVVLAASPGPSASTTPSTHQPSAGMHSGAMPGGCTHNGTNGSSGSSGSSGGSTAPSGSDSSNG